MLSIIKCSRDPSFALWYSFEVSSKDYKALIRYSISQQIFVKVNGLPTSTLRHTRSIVRVSDSTGFHLPSLLKEQDCVRALCTRACCKRHAGNALWESQYTAGKKTMISSLNCFVDHRSLRSILLFMKPRHQLVPSRCPPILLLECVL